MKIFCLPPAGGSASNYVNFIKASSVYAKFIAVEYPGHGALLRDAALKDMASLVKYATLEIEKRLDEADSFILFGHSMGAMLAYEIAHHFGVCRDNRLKRVFLCGCASPNYLMSAYDEFVLLSDDDFAAKLSSIGGITKEMASNILFRELFLNVVRKDFRIISEYLPQMRKLSVPASIMVAEDDMFTSGKYKTWKMFCSDADFHIFTGGHFFVANNPEVLQTVYDYCNQLHAN